MIQSNCMDLQKTERYIFASPLKRSCYAGEFRRFYTVLGDLGDLIPEAIGFTKAHNTQLKRTGSAKATPV